LGCIAADEVDAGAVGQAVRGKQAFAAMKAEDAGDAGFPIDLVQGLGGFQEIEDVPRVAEEVAVAGLEESVDRSEWDGRAAVGGSVGRVMRRRGRGACGL
jgi:hypothetical protein